MTKYPSQTQDKFTVRFPDGLRDAIAKRAEENGRSMNSEIVQILQDVIDNKIVLLPPSRKSEPMTLVPKIEREILEEIARLAAENAVKLERNKK
ncbi:Arc family DNA-binding protein [Xenorhabdus sp. BG5]|uniref:Arc family DNA-binding protein n=1 Tax=Xenorhabdus sp. BG5 TaxID=2782014 RepID=UPI001882EE65|nr:Arc family DNA-binding protein [Xenorhabdus sp. BG5]MBE8596871.1 Arc family DNA-binding protein [Xenorhabdus sp. BG5]